MMLNSARRSRETRPVKATPTDSGFRDREVADRLSLLPADVWAEIEKRLPGISENMSVPVQDLRIVISEVVGGATGESGKENPTAAGEAECLIHISLQILQQFTGLDV